LATASALVQAAIEGALANVEINLTSMKDGDFVTATRQKAEVIIKK
jgi:formiminotetrahydrofolate cyclodeaminase